MSLYQKQNVHCNESCFNFLYHFKPLAKVHNGSNPGVQSSDMGIHPLLVAVPEVPTITLDLEIMSKRPVKLFLTGGSTCSREEEKLM